MYVYIGEVAIVKGEKSQKVYSCLYDIQRNEPKDCSPTLRFDFSRLALNFSKLYYSSNMLESFVCWILDAEKSWRWQQNSNWQFGRQSFGSLFWGSDIHENTFSDFAPFTIYECITTHIPYHAESSSIFRKTLFLLYIRAVTIFNHRQDR